MGEKSFRSRVDRASVVKSWGFHGSGKPLTCGEVQKDFLSGLGHLQQEATDYNRRLASGELSLLTPEENGYFNQLLIPGGSQIMGYAADVFPMLKNISVVSQRVPEDGMFQYANIRGMEVLLPDLEASRQMLEDTLTK